MTEHNSEADSTFPIYTGTELSGDWPHDERAAQVQAAVKGLEEIRRVTNPGTRPLTVPAPWERLQPLRVVSLLLEAAGIQPSAVDAAGQRTRVGYCVSPGEGEDQVRVEWLGPRGSGAQYLAQERLKCCADVLQGWGFETMEVKGRGGRRHLEVEPGR